MRTTSGQEDATVIIEQQVELSNEKMIDAMINLESLKELIGKY